MRIFASLWAWPLWLILAIGVAGCEATTATAPTWMSADVQPAWNAGYKGQSTTITVVDGFAGATIQGQLVNTVDRRTHGAWVAQQSQLMAPSASVRRVDFNTSSNSPYRLAAGLNIINNSYAIMGGPAASFGNLPPLERATILHARNGTAVVIKAAGNDAAPINALVGGQKDVLNTELMGAPSAIIVGALTSNGTPTARANLASYSNIAGADAQAQSNFLVVGVASDQTGLQGTSFAAPIVSGYASIVGSKFTNATPTQITNQLLNTARTDTIQGYNPQLHGRGEASLSRALAPAALQ